MPTPSWTVSFTMPTASNSPAKACAGHEANRTRRLDQPPSPVTQIHRPARLATRAASFRYGGRHHSGIPGDIIPLYPGDFVGIRSIHLQARLEDEKQCILVLIGATPEGRKELVGFTDGARESAQDWRDLLLDLKR